MLTFGINRLGVFRRVIKYVIMKINRYFNTFIDLKLLELEVFTICLDTRYVLGYKNKR